MMTSERECYVYVVPPGETEFATAGRFRVAQTPAGAPLGKFIHGRSYLRRDSVVELDPVELRLERIGESRLDFGGGCGNFQVMQADQTALAGTDFVRRGRQ